MDSSPPRQEAGLPPVTSQERLGSAKKPTLLPPFEPLSSSPLPRAPKRRYDEGSPSLSRAELKYYPTPIPTSSTGVLPSSPTRLQLDSGRPRLERTMSTLSERTPLGAVPTVEIPYNGEPILMGRSSNSSHHQLSANRLISRVHIRAQYHRSTLSHADGELVIECLGWNGAKVHCLGQVYQLLKGDTFTSDRPSADIMVDVQDTRVMVAWPHQVRKDPATASSVSTWHDDVDSPRGTPEPVDDHFRSSPPPLHLRSPVSPTPVNNLTESATFLAPDLENLSNEGGVEVYRDEDSDDELPHKAPSRSRSRSAGFDAKSSQSSGLSSSLSSDEFSDRDEENDPIVHSFGPFGANVLARMASFTTSSDTEPLLCKTTETRRRKKPLKDKPTSRGLLSASELQEAAESGERRFNESPVRNHVINQLAFSRLHSIPLSTILNNLPVELKSYPERDITLSTAHVNRIARTTVMTPADLKKVLDGTACVGEIQRQGKDAAGKPLENEFYYVPEMDTDTMRRDAVYGSMGKTGLRAVRRSHKQYYWKRPRH